MRIPLPANRRRARIEIIPLIDIVFFLLATFVMVSLSMIRNQAIPVRLPAASTGAAQDRSKLPVTVSVTNDGAIYLNKERVDLETLKARLSAMRRTGGEDLKIFINGDERAHFGSAVRVLDEVRKIGITKVAIQTKSEPVEGVK